MWAKLSSMLRYLRGHRSIALVVMFLTAFLFGLVDWELSFLSLQKTTDRALTTRSASCPFSYPWTVYVLSVNSRDFVVKKNLMPVFPCLHVIHGIAKEEANIENHPFAWAEPSDWDFPDRRILKTAYRESSYTGPGEVAVTIGHRRILETFLRAPYQVNNSAHAQVALILEDDAKPTVTIQDDLADIIDKIKSLDWDIIQLGRCYDVYCSKDRQLYPVKILEDGTRIQKSKGFELCSHAYLVSKSGAEKIMQYSYPVLLPYDHTLMLLGRTNLLKAYYTDKNFFFQSKMTSMRRDDGVITDKPICDPAVVNISKANVAATSTYDPVLIQYIQRSPLQELISVSARRIQSAKTILEAERMRQDALVDLCNNLNKSQYCIKQMPAQNSRQDCQFIGGTKTMIGQADTATRTFLDLMAQANLNGMIIWGLTPEDQHTHAHIHKAIHKAAKAAFEFSPTPMHLCYVQESPTFDLGRDLFNNTKRGRLANSLVFSSPKHMMWSKDPGFWMLPLDLTARYVFHGETPRPHTVLKSAGVAIEHETWGPDGNIPIIDSDFFQRGLTSLNMSGCKVNFNAKRFVCPERSLIVESWATELTPAEIAINKQRVKNHDFPLIKQNEMHFQGSIWSCNVENFLYFTRGCKESDISVVRHGLNIGPLDVRPLDISEELLRLMNFRMKQSFKTLAQILTESNSQYAPAFQGGCHFTSQNSSEWYIADRIFNVIAAGNFPLTNNVAAFELLDNSSAIVYHESTYALCRSFLEHTATKEDLIRLMDVVANKHTYVSRLSSMLDFIASIPVNGKAISKSVSITLSDQVIKFDTLDTAVLANALDECNSNIPCVIERVPVHPSQNCSQTIFGLNHQIGEDAAYAFSGALSCAGIRHFNHMSPELYEQGSPHVHFVRDPLEVVVSGYFEHTESNASWLESSGIKTRLKSRSIDKALLMEYKAIAEWNINNSALVYNLKKTKPLAKHDFFTIRVDQLGDEGIFNVTVQALQKWLGGSPTIPLKKFASSERPEYDFIRTKVMDQFYAEISKYRGMLEYPEKGREDWTRPPVNRSIQWWPVLVGAILAFASLIGPTLCYLGLSQAASAYHRNSKRQWEGNGVTAMCLRFARPLAKRVIVEWCWSTPLFGIQDPLHRKDLDLTRSFCPRPFSMTLFCRLSLLLMSLHVLWMDMNLFSFPTFYFAFISQVTHGLTILYFLVSLSVVPSFWCNEKMEQKTNVQPKFSVCFYWVRNDCHRFYFPFLTRLSQGFFAAIVTCQFIVTTVFWSVHSYFFFHILPKRQRYPALMKHGILFVLIVLEGRFYSRIPLRAKHVIFPSLILALYGAWTMFQSSFGPSNPFFYGQEHPCCHPMDDDAVYPQLNWKKRPIPSCFNYMLSYIFVPLHYYFLWSMFCWSGRFGFDGSNQHFQNDRLVGPVKQSVSEAAICRVDHANKHRCIRKLK